MQLRTFGAHRKCHLSTLGFPAAAGVRPGFNGCAPILPRPGAYRSRRADRIRMNLLSTPAGGRYGNADSETNLGRVFLQRLKHQPHVGRCTKGPVAARLVLAGSPDTVTMSLEGSPGATGFVDRGRHLSPAHSITETGADRRLDVRTGGGPTTLVPAIPASACTGKIRFPGGCNVT